jgi:two-component system, sensor histidine kinase and response regulator
MVLSRKTAVNPQLNPTYKARVLLVDDDEEDYLIVKKLMARSPYAPFDLDWEPDTVRAARRITECKHDAYLIDYRLEGQTGLELLGTFNLFERVAPFIILTGASDEKLEQQALDMGVADYLVKGSFDVELLSRVLRYSIQRKLLEAQRIQQLVEINRSKDEFIALASHQLRTPATAVKQYVGMLMDGYAGDLTKDQMRLLKTAYQSNERQLLVVNDILKIAQLDLEKVVLKPRRRNIGRLIETVLKDVYPAAVERSQQVDYVQPDDPVRASVDGDFFRMAIGNIIDNASKYTPEGGAITITLEGQPAGSATIEVHDEGVGIAIDDMEKLFKKFSRIQNPLSVKVGGTGLGLYWANEIIELHGGTIQVSSKLGRGTTFLITLPPAKSSTSI